MKTPGKQRQSHHRLCLYAYTKSPQTMSIRLHKVTTDYAYTPTQSHHRLCLYAYTKSPQTMPIRLHKVTTDYVYTPTQSHHRLCLYAYTKSPQIMSIRLHFGLLGVGQNVTLLTNTQTDRHLTFQKIPTVKFVVAAYLVPRHPIARCLTLHITDV